MRTERKSAPAIRAILRAADRALKNGARFDAFRQDISPVLARGGLSDMRVDLPDQTTGQPTLLRVGSRAWLETVFRANIGMAYAKGHWERIERLKDRLPYLRYSAVHDRRSRPEHLAWHGIVLPVDHPWWRTHFPLNGWRCRCSTMQLDAADLARYGYSVFSVPDELTREWSDKRTDEILQVPVGIDPGFDFNIGRTDLAAERRRITASAFQEG